MFAWWFRFHTISTEGFKMNAPTFIVIEYLPHTMHRQEWLPARLDGHYTHEADANGVADLWAENPKHSESRIVVCEVHHEAKAPDHWIKREAAE